MPKDNINHFSHELIRWYRKHRRELPWRTTRDPYLIWLSEIILQQTRVAQGLPYYNKFVCAYPDVRTLAAADTQDILRLWQGLGYYSRARNLHKCAKTVVEKYGGRFPDNYLELLNLPGIGPYTASAVASFAFGKAEAVVDGNVFRVLARFFGVERDIGSGKGQRYFRDLAARVLPEENPATYNQAIMEFGALQCTPATPDCPSCPLMEGCEAFAAGKVNSLPVKSRKTSVKQVYMTYLVLREGDRLYMEKRDSGIWQGLFQFLLLPGNGSAGSATSYLQEQLTPEEFELGEPSEVYIHLLSHRRLHSVFREVWLRDGAGDKLIRQSGGRFYSAEEMEELPKPVLIEKYLRCDLFKG